MDQNRPPYWLGEGDKVPDPPGAAVDLIRDAVRRRLWLHAVWVRLPVARLRWRWPTAISTWRRWRTELLPRRDCTAARQGRQYRPGTRAAQPVLVLVRTRTSCRRDQSHAILRGKTLGIPQGNAYAARLREAGLTLDDGGRDLDRNIEKLKLGRRGWRGGGGGGAGPPQANAGQVQRRDRTAAAAAMNIRVWLAFNDSFYRAHTPQSEALWTWLDKTAAASAT
jgi:hypothetical protein